MKKRKRSKLITTQRVAKKQHTKPCSDCPFARESLPGWLGGQDAAWTALYAGWVACHVFKNTECAGHAIYQANLKRMPRTPDQFKLPEDREVVFATFQEFMDHHGKVEGE